MALQFRCTRLFQLSSDLPIRKLLGSQIRGVTLVPRKIEDTVAGQSHHNHDERNALLQRPQSPHLTIYRFQLTAVLSITHRFTGIALAGYVYGMGVLSLTSSKPIAEVIQSLHGIDPALIYSGKFLIALPFAYHFVNGIRHLVWDMGKALTIKGVYTTGYIMVGTSTLLALALCQL